MKELSKETKQKWLAFICGYDEDCLTKKEFKKIDAQAYREVYASISQSKRQVDEKYIEEKARILADEICGGFTTNKLAWIQLKRLLIQFASEIQRLQKEGK